MLVLRRKVFPKTSGDLNVSAFSKRRNRGLGSESVRGSYVTCHCEMSSSENAHDNLWRTVYGSKWPRHVMRNVGTNPYVGNSGPRNKGPGLFVFRLLRPVSSLQLLESSPLPEMSFARIFSHPVGCLLVLLVVAFAVRTLFISMTSQ